MIRRAGEHGWLVETGALEISHRLDAALRAERPPEVREIVPGPETVLVVAPGADQSRLRELLDRLVAHCRGTPAGSTAQGEVAEGGGSGTGTTPRHEQGARPGVSPPDRTNPYPYGGTGRPQDGGTVLGTNRRQSGGPDSGTGSTRIGRAGADVVTIPVVYDGEDLGSVAEAAGISVAEVAARHTGRELVVGWLGFAPGFAYLTGLDPLLHVPRLATPRTSVPAGSVAIAGPYSAVYPTASPGGWRLLGRTDATVWDVSAEPPTPFRPGVRVRFEAA